jgi:hypothetical protein
MRISKKDWIFIAIVAGVFAIFFAISGEEKTTRVPMDENHKASYEIFKKTGKKMDADKGCPVCHFEPGGVPFPAKHPVKPKDGPSRCLFCHKLKLAGV